MSSVQTAPNTPIGLLTVRDVTLRRTKSNAPEQRAAVEVLRCVYVMEQTETVEKSTSWINNVAQSKQNNIPKLGFE